MLGARAKGSRVPDLTGLCQLSEVRPKAQLLEPLCRVLFLKGLQSLVPELPGARRGVPFCGFQIRGDCTPPCKGVTHGSQPLPSGCVAGTHYISFPTLRK